MNQSEEFKLKSQEFRAWGRLFDAPEALAERSRVMAKVMKRGESVQGIEEYELRELLRLASMLARMERGNEQAPWIHDAESAKAWRADLERGVAHYLMKVMTSCEAKRRLTLLAGLTGTFPITQAQPAFTSHLSAPHDFNPTLQDGLKAVLLYEFFYQRAQMRGAYSGLCLPTIKELDSAIREKWKWNGGDKELRDARRELGLSGLPRAKSGRRKSRGKK